MKILLVTKASGKNHSIEAGVDDRVMNFDHHGSFSGNKAPCNDPSINGLKNGNDIIEITHTDSDTLIGLMRLLGMSIPDLDYNEMEKIDLNGSSVVSKDSEVLAYMEGVMDVVMKAGVPRSSPEPQDVTGVVNTILNAIQDKDKMIAKGKANIKKSEDDYNSAPRYIPSSKVLTIFAAKDSQINPSRAYEDGYDICVFYREQWESISLYANPKSKVNFMENPVYSGITFAGHPKACGSPRGTKFAWNDAIGVAIDVNNKFGHI